MFTSRLPQNLNILEQGQELLEKLKTAKQGDKRQSEAVCITLLVELVQNYLQQLTVALGDWRFYLTQKQTTDITLKLLP